MRDLQNKIRNGIANSYHLRDLAKDDKLTGEERDRIIEIVKKNDEKIKYYKMMNKLLSKNKNEEKTTHSHK